MKWFVFAFFLGLGLQSSFSQTVDDPDPVSVIQTVDSAVVDAAIGWASIEWNVSRQVLTQAHATGLLTIQPGGIPGYWLVVYGGSSAIVDLTELL